MTLLMPYFTCVPVGRQGVYIILIIFSVCCMITRGCFLERYTKYMYTAFIYIYTFLGGETIQPDYDPSQRCLWWLNSLHPA